LGEKKKTVNSNRSKTRDLAAGLEISTKAADIWVQTDEISCMMTEITTYVRIKPLRLGLGELLGQAPSERFWMFRTRAAVHTKCGAPHSARFRFREQCSTEDDNRAVIS